MMLVINVICSELALYLLLYVNYQFLQYLHTVITCKHMFITAALLMYKYAMLL